MKVIKEIMPTTLSIGIQVESHLISLPPVEKTRVIGTTKSHMDNVPAKSNGLRTPLL
ncbi:hypothetical protein SDC9_171228 [bioreactor metagenome]|uniref:Uncharacterized protein n=1 Tax=bioreactor metagenome TaxID=1076179 RepID=A0A645GB24_9ZZZZ